jgi:hypothetical protein
MRKKSVSRREFLKRSAGGPAAIAALAPGLVFARDEPQPTATIDRHAVIAAIGDTLIPTDPGDPGYKSLEKYRITEEVMKELGAVPDSDLEVFTRGCGLFFAGRTFLQLTESQRAEFLRFIIEGSRFSDKAQLRTLQRVYRQTRTRIFTVFYQNYPENVIPRDQNGTPILRAGDKHQITNPNTKAIITGWDIAGFEGPLTWEQEERDRAIFKRTRWQE